MECTAHFCLPYSTKLDTKNKTITITYNEHILCEPGVEENLKRIGNDLAEYIEAGFKKGA